MLALDLGVFNKTAHVIRPREAARWVFVWVALALLFCAGLAIFLGSDSALTFLTGYLIEESLSVDNIFVMVLIFHYFRTPAKYQHRVLFWGILGALVMRGIFIGLGALLIRRFDWILYVFGAFLVVTGFRMFSQKQEQEFDPGKNLMMRTARRWFRFTNNYDGQRFFTLENGRRVGTPLLLALLLIEFTDLMFAVDSIPAIFSITNDPFLIYTSNIFAILGLRSMYFLLVDVVRRFYLLHYGLAIILGFVGVKMLLGHVIHVPIVVSLMVILTVLAASIAASLLIPRRSDAPR
jgi:tellurite resistance protein TerC